MPYIPEPVKRQVRQEAGFGCCKCGFPIIEYHHIVKESQEPRDIMVLCPICHTEATVGAMPEDEQRAYKENAYNIKRGFVEGKLRVHQKTPVINIGTNQFVGDGNFIIVDGENLLSTEINEGQLELSMKLYDPEDNLVAKVVRNEWISGNPLPWDLESRFQRLRIRRKLRDIKLEIDARGFPIDIRADMWRNRQNFQLNPDQILFNGVVKNAGVMNLCLVAIRLEVDTSKQNFSIAPDPRFGSGSLASHHNIEERVKIGLLAWERLTCEHKFETIIDRKKYAVRECKKCGEIEKTWKQKGIGKTDSQAKDCFP